MLKPWSWISACSLKGRRTSEVISLTILTTMRAMADMSSRLQPFFLMRPAHRMANPLMPVVMAPPDSRPVWASLIPITLWRGMRATIS